MNTGAVGNGAGDNVIPVRPIQVRLARLGVVGAILLLVFLWFFGSPSITIETHGDATIYTSNSPSTLIFYAFPVLTAVAAIVHLLQPGMFRSLGAGLVLITVWLVYTAVTTDFSNHYVQVSPDGMVREVGTRANPVRQEVDFSKTAYLYIDQVSGKRGPEYELVAYAAADGAETRIPIYSLMRAALPQIMDAACERDVIIGGSEDGLEIPAALRR